MFEDEQRTFLGNPRWILAAFVLLIGLIVFLFRSPPEPEWGDETFTHWVYAKLEGDTNRAEKAQLALVEMAPRAIPYLLHGISRTDSKVIPALNHLLAKLPWDIYFPDGQDAWDYQASAIKGFQALGSLGKPAVPRLEKLLFKEETAFPAALALADVNGAESLPILCVALTNRNAAVSRAAIKGMFLLRTNAESALPILLQLSQSTNREIAIAAIGTLGSIGTNQPQRVLATLQRALNESAADDLYSPLYAVGHLGPGAKPLVPDLLKHLTNSISPSNRRIATGVLVQVLQEEALPHLVNLINTPDAMFQQVVISQLAELGTNAAPAVPLLVSFLEAQPMDPKDPTTREEFLVLQTVSITLVALARIESQPELVVPVLTNMLTHSMDWISGQSAVALGCFGKEARSAVPLLMELAVTRPLRGHNYPQVPDWMQQRLGLQPREWRDPYELALENIDPQAAATIQRRFIKER